MSRNWSKAIPEGIGLVPQQEEFVSDQPALADVYRLFEESFDRWLKIMKSRFGQQEKKLRATERRSASLEQDARQPRLAMEADVPSDTKTCQRTEGAAATVQAKYGDNCSVNLVDPDLMCLTSFGDGSTGPSAFPFSKDDALGRQRRCGAKAVSLTLGDAHTNSCCRWLTPRRQSLYNDDDYLLLTTSSVLPDREDKF